MAHLQMIYLQKKVIFHCYVELPESIQFFLDDIILFIHVCWCPQLHIYIYVYIFIHSTLYRPIKQTNSLKTFRMSVFPLYLKLFFCSIVSSTAIHGKLVHLTSATTTVAPCAAAARALTHGKPSAPLVLLNLAGHHLRTPYSIPTICLVT